MNNRSLKLLGFVVGMFGASAAAADFDGSEPLMCSLGQVVECDAGEKCRVVTNESVDAPDFVKLDFKKKQMMSTTAGEDSPAADVRVTDVTTHIVVQGTQGSGEGNALGYSMSINKATGKMVAAGAGENAGFVIFGACAPM